MKHNVIARSKSGKTCITLNGDGTISLNGRTPICTLSQLKWLKAQPNFKAGFLNRIPGTFFENLTEEPFDVTSLPIIATAVLLDFNGNIENVKTWYGKDFDGCFCSFKKDGNIAFVNNTMIDQNWEFLEDGETIEKFIERRQREQEKAAIRNQAWLKRMYNPAKGWYVVTLNVNVSRIRGNDGIKTYSFKVLAENQMDAYFKTCDTVMNNGVKDRNVSFVYNVADSAKSALIDFVGAWTDESEMEYGS
jgi:hypothetical protein